MKMQPSLERALRNKEIPLAHPRKNILTFQDISIYTQQKEPHKHHSIIIYLF
jgi:hypothetical protein